MDSKYLQSQHNNIDNNNDVEFLLAYIKKLQNTAEDRILASNKIVLLTKNIVDRK